MNARVGHYELLGALGRGGIGAVYRARDVRSGREVALKVLLCPSSNALERFRREVQALRRVRHPRVVALLDAGEHQGRPYVVLERLPGETLQGRLEAEGPLSSEAAVELGLALLEGLEAAHAAGVLHRDLKPSNVLFDVAGQPTLVDLGLARFLDGDHERLSRSGVLLGTPGYMAPEQAAGDWGLVGAATDVYGVGALLYACVTQQPPFAADSVSEVLVQTVDVPPRPPRALCADVHPGLERVILRCLEKEPAARYLSLAALREALEGCWVAAPRPVWARPGVWVAGGLVCAASLGGALVAALSGPASEEELAFVVDLPEPASPAAAGSSVSEEVLEEVRRLRRAEAFEESWVLAKAGVEGSPGDVRLRLELGIAGYLAQRGEPLEQLEWVLERDPESALALAWRGAYRVEHGELEAGAADIARAEALAPEEVQVLQLRSQVLLKQAKPREALEVMRRAEALAPEDGQVLADLAVACLANGLGPEGVACLDRAVALEPGKAQGYRRRGSLYMRLGRREEALVDLRRAVLLEPRDWRNTWPLVTVLVGAGRREEALAVLGRFLAVRPESVEALAQRAQVLASLGQMEEALRDTRAALALDPSDPNLYVNCAVLVAQEGDFPGALEELAPALELEPRLGVWKLHAELCMGVQRWAEAEEAVGRALELVQEGLEAHTLRCYLAECHLHQGRAREALALVQGAETRDALALRGMARLTLGLEGARADLEAALAQFPPEHPRVRDLRQGLGR